MITDKILVGALILTSATSLATETTDIQNETIVVNDVSAINDNLTKINKVIINALYSVNKDSKNNFVYDSYLNVGIKLENDISQMKEKNGIEIKKEHLRRGDLVFYEKDNSLKVGLFNGSDSIIIIENKAITLEKVSNLEKVFCKRIVPQNTEEETLIEKEKEEAKKLAEEKAKQEEAKKLAEEKAKQVKSQEKTTSNKKEVAQNEKEEVSNSTSQRNDGLPYFDSNGLLAMKNSPNARKAINLLLGIPGHRNGKSYHKRTGLDDLINSLSVEEATYVIRKIEGSGFGQTSDGYAGIDSHASHNTFLNRQVKRRFGGSIHALLRAWGTYSYGGY